MSSTTKNLLVFTTILVLAVACVAVAIMINQKHASSGPTPSPSPSPAPPSPAPPSPSPAPPSPAPPSPSPAPTSPSSSTNAKLVRDRAPRGDKINVIDEFYGMVSNKGNGLNLLGQYCENGTVVSEFDKSLRSAKDLKAYPLTYRCGHSYYKSGFGRLQGGSWKSHVNAITTKLDTTKYDGNAVLLVEDGMPVNLSGTVTLLGIVVRRGGVLLIADIPTTLHVQFILVESGGLFQAGAPGDGIDSKVSDHSVDLTYRYRSMLRVIFTHPETGYSQMPVLSSQYSYQVYAPGVQGLVSTEPEYEKYKGVFASYDGTAMCFTNGFGAKGLYVGFNGNVTLCGLTTMGVVYNGTWKSVKDGSNHTNGSESLTIGDNNFLSAAYPLTWARLKNGSGELGTTTLQLHADDVASLNNVELADVMPVGTRILVTNSTPQLTTPEDSVNVQPLFIADPDGRDDQGQSSNMRANTAANASQTFMYPTRGIEVAIVKNVSGSGLITLLDPLKYDHTVEGVDLTNDGGTVHVETCLHVAILSRNIVIDGQDLQSSKAIQGGSGCNIFDGSMALGLQNQTPNQHMGPLIQAGLMATHELHDSMSSAGSGGSIVPNYAVAINGQTSDVALDCYLDKKSEGSNAFWGSEKPPTSIPGSWIFGTSEASEGCNSILGASCMFKYGSSVWIDAVEVVRMGIAPNFGSIGQYALHFHLYGFAKSFKGYLHSDSPRDATVRNCSIWRSYSRFITLHGACEVDISNNIGFLTYGSGFFVEDGTEQLNVFQHNLGVMACPAAANDYFNPQAIYGNISTDYCVMSMFWLKNSLNVIARNVSCCCPGNTIAVWYVPQNVGFLRGPSAVCYGSEELELPACGSRSAITSDGLGVKPSGGNAKTNNQGALRVFLSGESCFKSGDATSKIPCSCWVPNGFSYPFNDPTTGCSTYTSNNILIPVFYNAENVAYCMQAYQSESPDIVRMPPQYFSPSAPPNFNVPANGCGWRLQSNTAKPIFIPIDGQNACLDQGLGVGTYPTPVWACNPDDSYAYQPLSENDRLTANDGCTTWTQNVGAEMIPKIFSGLLVWNVGCSDNLWGGAGWTKGVPAFLLNCCLLETSSRTSGISEINMAITNFPTGAGSYSSDRSTIFASNMGVNDNETGPQFSNYFVVNYNLLTNGCINISANVTIYAGDKTWFNNATAVAMVGGEVMLGATATLQIATFDLNFQQTFSKIIGKLGSNVAAPLNQLQIFEYASDKSLNYYTQILANPPQALQKKGSFSLPTGQDWPGAPVKMPYLCGGSKDAYGLLRDSSLPNSNNKQKPSWLGNIVANAVTGHFTTLAAQRVGDAVCQALAKVWWNVSRLTVSGQTMAINPIPQNPSCKVPAKFMV